jgi:hypothetical protein
MALVGHSAAGLNVFLDIPLLLRGLSQSMYSDAGPVMEISGDLLNEIQKVDPSDPTGIYDEYLNDWWNFEKEWETHPVDNNHGAAFMWHVKKVNDIFIFGANADVPPICIVWSGASK